MKITSIFLLSLTLLLTPSVQGSDARDRAIKLEIQVAAPVKKFGKPGRRRRASRLSLARGATLS